MHTEPISLLREQRREKLQQYYARMNRTSRPSGVGGRMPSCYKVARDYFTGYLPDPFLPPDCGFFLDFGAGKGAVHALRLREEFGVEAQFRNRLDDRLRGWIPSLRDVGETHKSYGGLQDEDRMHGKYDLVILSNVLNVQPNKSDFRAVLGQAWALVREGGVMIVNYPKEPRHNKTTDEEFAKRRHGLRGLRCEYSPKKHVHVLKKEGKERESISRS